MVKYIIPVVVGFGSGAVIAGAVFAFIAIIGVVPRLAQKTKTTKYILLYEEAIIVGGIFGALTIAFDFSIHAGYFLVGLFSFCNGVFWGCLAVSLAEVLDVIPVLTRRTGVKTGLTLFVISIAAGKFIGSLMYFVIPGFFNLD